jgi:hypothetical protein
LRFRRFSQFGPKTATRRNRRHAGPVGAADFGPVAISARRPISADCNPLILKVQTAAHTRARRKRRRARKREIVPRERAPAYIGLHFSAAPKCPLRRGNFLALQPARSRGLFVILPATRFAGT